MTLHITTITPNHVVIVSDRLVVTTGGYRELDNDRYKHLVLITDDARAVITYAGFAGILGQDNQLGKTTIDWLTDTICNTSHEGYHTIQKHMDDIRDHAQEYVDGLRAQGISLETLRLAVAAWGWIGGEQFGYVIDNCIDKWWTWADKARPCFRMRAKTYGNDRFRDGSHTAVLCNERLAMRQRALFRLLEIKARSEQPKEIFNVSVSIIRAAAAAPESIESIGNNCSGVRISRNDPGIEEYDDRIGKNYIVMSNFIVSQSKMSFYTGNFRGYSGVE